MTPEDLRQSALFRDLRMAAARLGQDPMQIQGPGGNVSVKSDGLMLVKASGTWLADAQSEDIFTAVDAAAMTAAVRAGDPTADTPQHFQIGPGLKPSIETGFHAILDASVVLHTHCVATLARATAPISKAQLEDLRLVWVDYCKPGAHLAEAILNAWHPGARGVVLGNHGIISVGQSVAEAESVLTDARAAFDAGPVPTRAPEPAFVAALDGSGWTALGTSATTALAFDPEFLNLAIGAAYFPDQVVFLGPCPRLVDAPMPIATDKTFGGLLFASGRGAAVPAACSQAHLALAEMMGEVIFRLPENPRRLTDAEITDLLGWDAEAHRQALEKARMTRQTGTSPE